MIWQLAWHEWRRVRAGVLFWLILAITQLLIAWLLFAQLEGFARIAPQLSASGAGLGAMDLIIAPTLGSLVLILIFSVPLLGQGGFATEHRQGRLTMWLSSPRSSMELVLGRVLGLFISGLPLLLSSALTIAAIGFGVEFDWLRFGTALGMLVVFLLWLSAIVIGLSTLTNHTVAALSMAYGALLFLWLLDSFIDPTAGWYWAALLPHLESTFRGLLRISDIAFFVSTGAAAAWFAVYRIACRRGEL